MQLSWFKPSDHQWCSLNDNILPPVGDHGVFLLWRNGANEHMSVVLYVGRGALAHEITRCRRDPVFHGDDVKITWATVYDLRLIDGVAAYLYHRLLPMWGEVVPWSQPLPVNLPAA